MKQSSTIQKFIAGFLLILFTISIAPKVYFHNLLADHKDVAGCTQLHKTAVLHIQGYNCHFDDLVVTAPYFLQTEEPALLINLLFETRQPVLSPFFLPSFSQHKENRGPPSA